MIVPMLALAALGVASIYFASLLEHAGAVTAGLELFAFLEAVIQAGVMAAAAIVIVFFLLA